MNREDLKNTPWRAILLDWGKDLYKVVDDKEFVLAQEVNKSTAKAIASLPETLAELELEKYHRRQDKKLAETLHADLKLSNQIHRKLEFELEKVKADNERLKSNQLRLIERGILRTISNFEEYLPPDIETQATITAKKVAEELLNFDYGIQGIQNRT